MNPTDDELTPPGDELNPAPAAPPAAPPQAAIPVADLSGALVEAYNRIVTSQPQVQRPVQDPFDAMSEQEKQDLASQAITDPIGAFRKAQAMGARATEQRLMQQAIPLIQTSANNIVEMFKMKKARSDKYFAQVEPLFDKAMVGIDITPLVGMNEATRTHELDMRWKMARADVLEVEMKKIRPEPLLTSSGGPGPASNKAVDDPWMANMAAEYKYTKEQLAELEALNG